MLKNLVTTASLLLLYRYIKKDWVDTDQYKVGLIDANGDMIKLVKLTKDQAEVNTKFNKFLYTLKKILDTYPLLKFQFMRSLLNILFVRESSINMIPSELFVIGIHEGHVVIVDANNRALLSNGLMNVYSETGVYTIPSDTVLEDSTPITNTTAGVAYNPPVLGDIIRKAATGLRRRKKRRDRRIVTIDSDDFAVIKGFHAKHD
jgi:hypothetical protein